MKFFLIVIILASCVFPLTAQANTRTATTCDDKAVQSAVVSAGDGDTVVVPAGNCSWHSGVTVRSGIILKGAGAGTTVIIDETDDQPLIDLATKAGKHYEVTGFTFRGGSERGTRERSPAISI